MNRLVEDLFLPSRLRRLRMPKGRLQISTRNRRRPGKILFPLNYFDFAQSVTNEGRFFHGLRATRFLKEVKSTCQDHSRLIDAATVLWRAQIGFDTRPSDKGDGYVVDCAYGAARMKPLPNRASDGRANPKGIPYLYCALSPITAISEVRPWVGSVVSLGRFRPVRTLRVVDCANKPPVGRLRQELLDPTKLRQTIWQSIESAFAEPTTRADDLADYVPTQILAELFKRESFDGILYRSHFGGANLVLFDTALANMESCELQQVAGLDLHVLPAFERMGPYKRRGP